MSYLDKRETLELEFESLIETLHILKDSRETASDSANELLTEYISDDIHEVMVEICKTSQALCELADTKTELPREIMRGLDTVGKGTSDKEAHEHEQ